VGSQLTSSTSAHHWLVLPVELQHLSTPLASWVCQPGCKRTVSPCVHAALHGRRAGWSDGRPQVRAEAYRGLCAYPLDTQEQAGVLPPLSHLTAPLVLCSAADGAAPTPFDSGATASSAGPPVDCCDAGSEHPLPPAFEQDAGVRLHLERLAVKALEYEHANRRRFFMAFVATAARGAKSSDPGGNTAAGSSAGGGGAVGAAQARGHPRAERDFDTLRHRLLVVAPALVVGATGAPSAAAAAAHPVSPSGGAQPGSVGGPARPLAASPPTAAATAVCAMLLALALRRAPQHTSAGVSAGEAAFVADALQRLGNGAVAATAEVAARAGSGGAVMAAVPGLQISPLHQQLACWQSYFSARYAAHNPVHGELH
jgi:hypothetical protein